MRKKMFFSLIFSLFICCTCLMNVSADTGMDPTQMPEVTEIPPTNTPEPPKALEPIGDINEDVAINAEDALLALKYAAKITDLADINGFLLRGDVDKSGDIDASDALYILKYAAGIIDSFEDIDVTVNSTEIPEDYYVISSGQTKDVTISTANEKVTFEFTPAESGYYRYHSSNDKYTEFGTINDSEGKLLVQRTDYYQDHANYVFTGKFSFDYYFEAGKTYYLEAFLDRDDTGSFKVVLMPLAEPEKVVINGKEPINCPYGTEKELKVSYSPEYSIGFIEKWESSDAEIVAVDENGKIKGVGIGTASVTVTTTGGLTYTTEIEVTDHDEILVGDLKTHTALFEAEDYFKFVPETDGEYIIKSYRTWHPTSYVSISVYDAEFKNRLYSEDGIDFEINCEFKAGEAYYIVMKSNAGDNGFDQYLEIVDIDDVIELSVGDTIKLPDLEANSGTPYTWIYEVADEDEGIIVATAIDDSEVSAPGDGVKTICTLTAEESGVYYVHFRLSNESWSNEVEIIESITYKVIVN